MAIKTTFKQGIIDRPQLIYGVQPQPCAGGDALQHGDEPQPYGVAAVEYVHVHSHAEAADVQDAAVGGGSLTCACAANAQTVTRATNNTLIDLILGWVKYVAI